jgi:hypothetical protein
MKLTPHSIVPCILLVQQAISVLWTRKALSEALFLSCWCWQLTARKRQRLNRQPSVFFKLQLLQVQNKHPSIMYIFSWKNGFSGRKAIFSEHIADFSLEKAPFQLETHLFFSWKANFWAKEGTPFQRPYFPRILHLLTFIVLLLLIAGLNQGMSSLPSVCCLCWKLTVCTGPALEKIIFNNVS